MSVLYSVVVGFSRGTEFIGHGFKFHSGQLSIVASKNSSVVNTIHIRNILPLREGMISI